MTAHVAEQADLMVAAAAALQHHLVAVPQTDEAAAVLSQHLMANHRKPTTVERELARQILAGRSDDRPTAQWCRDCWGTGRDRHTQPVVHLDRRCLTCGGTGEVAR